MLSTVLRNLLSNAIKFSYEGGEIKISSHYTNGFCEVLISDNGIGISKNNITKLFRIDISYKSPGTSNEQGTGLGLILCKAFIEKNGGKIWAESEEGNGTTLYFTIPKS